MSSVTFFKTILPIPESVVVGSGSYTVPANKYGYFQGFSSSTALASPAPSGLEGAVAAVSGSQWLISGATIQTSTTTINDVSSGTGTAFINYDVLAQITLNSVVILGATNRCTYQQNSTGNMIRVIRGFGSAGWSVSLFPIPVNNLPASLTT